MTFSCEKENLSDNEIQQGDNQAPQVNDQNLAEQEKIEIIVNFTPEEQIIKEKVLKVIYKNLEATEAEDVAGVMETIHEDSPQLSSTKQGMEYVFQNFKMSYEIEDIQFMSITDTVTQVIYQQTTKAVSGMGFNNTRSIGIHTMKKSKDGRWKIFGTEYLQSDPLQ
jgi:ketosteroid isomerase-like protein